MTVTNGPQLGVMVDAASGDSYPNDLRRALRALDAHLYFSAKSATTAAQPGSPADGDRYILPTSPTGTQWAGKAAGTIAVWTTRNTITSGGTESTTSTWEFFAPKRNWIAFVEDASDALIRYTGSVWTGNLQTAEDISIATGKVLKINGVQVLTSQQTGLGTALVSSSAGGTYGSTEQTMLQEAHDKIRLLETIVRAHGFATT